MTRHLRKSFWIVFLSVNLALLGLFFWGRGGWRNHFVVRLEQGKLAIWMDGRVMASDVDVTAIPAASRQGIRFILFPLERRDLPTNLKTRIERLAIYAPDGREMLFHLGLGEPGPPSWTGSLPNGWTLLPDGALRCAAPGNPILLRPAGVNLDSYRLEFDLVNSNILILSPVYAGQGDQVVLGLRSYTECLFNLDRWVNGRVEPLTAFAAPARMSHILRTIAHEILDSYPWLVAAVVVFLVLWLAVLRPLSVLWVRLSLSPRSKLWGAVGAGVLVAGLTAVVLKAPQSTRGVLKILADYGWGLAIAAVILVPAVLFVLRSFRRRRAPVAAPAKKAPGQMPACERRWPGWTALAALSILAGTGLQLWITSQLVERQPHVYDAAVQLFHARMLARGQFAVPITEELSQGHFTHAWMLWHQGRWFSQYSPGHLLVLAVGVLFGGPWIVPGLICGATLLVIYLVGVQMANRAVGLIAVWLTIFSPFFQTMGTSFMNHTTCALLWGAAVLFFIVGIRATSFWAFLGCGASLVMVFATRPLTAVGLATPLLLAVFAWALLSDRPRRLVRLLGLLVGAIPAAAFLLLYNYKTTGSPFVLVDQLAGSSKFGFNPISYPVGMAAEYVLFRTWLLKCTLFDWPANLTFVPIVALFASGRARRWDWLLLATCVTLAMAYTLYPSLAEVYGPRYWYEMLPVLCVLSARGVWEAAMLGRDCLLAFPGRPEAVRYQLCGLFAGLIVLLTSFTLWGINDFWLAAGPARQPAYHLVPRHLHELKGWLGVDGKLARAVAKANVHHAVVFIKPVGPYDYTNALPLNSPFFDSDVVYPLCLGSRADGRLMQLFASRKAYLAERLGDGWSIVPYPDNEPVPPRNIMVIGNKAFCPQFEPTPGNRSEALAEQVASAYPGWTLVAALQDAQVQLRSLAGRDNVIQLHPVSRNEAAVLRWRGTLEPNRAHELSFEVCSPPELGAPDCVVQAWVGRHFLGEVLTTEKGIGHWASRRYDLSAYPGKEVNVELWVVATDWYHEFACLSNLHVD